MQPHHLLQLVPNRVAATLERLRQQCFVRVREVRVEATAASERHARLDEARTRQLTSVSPGEAWGRLYDQRWCRLHLSDLPAHSFLEWRDQAEATLFVDGVPYYGFDVAHRYCPLPAACKEVWVESICVQSGIWHPEATGLSSAGSSFSGAYIARRDDLAWHAYHDLKCLFDAAMAERPGGARLNPIGHQASLEGAPPLYRRLLRLLDEAVDALDRGGLPPMRERLASAYAEMQESRPLTRATITGHAHIDLVWLWPERVGAAKTVHTFATMDRLMDQYPELRFMHSQAASYESVASRAPALLERVRRRIASGRWQATGVMHVESDTQLPCGEALSRSFSIGQQVFATLRASPPNVVWLPDAFGYASCLPQLILLSGAKYFFTNKVSWSAINRFPLSSFVWRGADGSEVVAHVLQQVGYNGEVQPADLKLAIGAHAQSDVHPEFLYPTGYGDGGGGVTEEMCERARRLASLRGLPAVSWDHPDAFFERLESLRDRLPTYAGELYLEYHRGTYTTHGNLKAAFRALERALQSREAVAVAGGTSPDLGAAWRRLVLAQFHDYIPGSSVPEVYEEALPELSRLAQEQIDAAREELQTAGGQSCYFNPLPMPVSAVVDGRLIRVPALSGITVTAATADDAATVRAGNDFVENKFVKASVDEHGSLRELRVEGEELALLPHACELVLYPDRPANFEAWDIDRQALSLGTVVDSPATVRIERDASASQAAIVVRRKVGAASEVELRYVLQVDSRVLRIELLLDWHEPETLLKLHLRTGYRGSQVRYGAPFGSTLRPQQPGSPIAEAMWEVPASRWMVGCDDGGQRGMFVVTRDKYGLSCRDGDWGVSLVRSPRVTGFEAHAAAYPAHLSRVGNESVYSDQGRHRICLAIGRFDARCPREQHPAALADILFTEPIAYRGAPCSSAFRTVQGGESLIPCWAKPLGPDAWILRLHEAGGERGTAQLSLASGWSAQPVDLLDRPSGAPLEDGRVSFRPYQIVSLRISRRPP